LRAVSPADTTRDVSQSLEETQSSTPWWSLERAYESGLSGTAEALFPRSDTAPDFQDTDLIARSFAYVASLPPPQRKLLKLLFIAVELCAPVLAPGLRRFSRRTPERRRADVNGWLVSWVYPLRLLGDGLKTTLQMIYLSHPSAVAHIGEYKVSTVPGDAFQVAVRGTAEVPSP
jgi:hypothetical protein